MLAADTADGIPRAARRCEYDWGSFDLDMNNTVEPSDFFAANRRDDLKPDSRKVLDVDVVVRTNATKAATLAALRRRPGTARVFDHKRKKKPCELPNEVRKWIKLVMFGQ